MTLHLDLPQRLQALPGRTHWLDGPTELRYEAARRRGDSIVAALEARGVPPGARIVAATRDEAELACLLLACLRLHLTLVPLALEATAAEVRSLVARAAPALVLADAAALASWDLPTGDAVLTLDPARRGLFGAKKPEPHALDALAKGGSSTTCLPFDAARDLLLLGTSGSSGAPKLVRVTVGNLVAQADTFAGALGMGADARVLNLSPLVHVDGITGVFCALWNASTLVRPGPFTVARLPDVLHALYRHRVTHALVVPTLLQLFLKLGEDLGTAFATGDLRLVVSTAAPLPDGLWSEIEAKTGVTVVNMFGLTETGNVLFTATARDRAADPRTDPRFGSLGRAVDAEARVAADGELEVRGASVSPGYFGEPARAEAWFATGDVVTRDAAGVFRLLGRKKNVIITGGRNVHAEEVDAALADHPAVLEAVTVGVPDDVWGERVESCVVLAGSPSPTDRAHPAHADVVARLQAHLAERLAPYKHPRRLHVVDALPKGASGKPSRPDVRALVIAQSARAKAAPDVDPRALEDEVVALAAEVFRAPALTLAARPGAPRTWDSLAHLQLVVRLEERFGVELEPREITRIDSLGRAVDLVVAKLAARRAPSPER